MAKIKKDLKGMHSSSHSNSVFRNPEIALPINYAGLAILYNILGLGAMYAKQAQQSAILIVYLLLLGNFLMFIGYFYILEKVRKWGAKEI